MGTSWRGDAAVGTVMGSEGKAAAGETKARLIAELEDAHQELLAAVAGIPEEKVSVPMLGEWSVKDILAHISSWDELEVQDLRRLGRGHVPIQADFREEEGDEWNDFLLKGRRPFSPEQVMAEFEANRQARREVLDGLPDPLFASGSLVRGFCEGTVKHDQEHAAQIRAWRQKQGV
jgi:hypothetical protein